MINKVKNYYVLFLLTVGIVDDFSDSLNEMLRAIKLPVSIIVINMANKKDNVDVVNFIKQGE